jgi:hypothetical protein
MEGQMLEQFLNESLEFYAKVRQENNITITSLTKEILDGMVVFTAVGSMPARRDGNYGPVERQERLDSASGAVDISGLMGEAKANAFKSAETQAKSRLTISLSGVRMPAPPRIERSLDFVAEPVLNKVPEVNQAPAEVVADIRKALVQDTPQATELTLLVVPVPEVKLPPTSVVLEVPVVTETQIAALHQEAKVLSAPVENPAERTVPAPAPVAAAAVIDGQASIFDEEPETLVVPQVAPKAPEVVDAVLAAVQQPTETGVVMPVPVAKSGDAPTRLEFQGFTTRCAHLCRNVLPKAGKDAPGKLMPYFRKVFGVKDLTPENTSISLWESSLSALEKAANPAEALKILNGGK